MLRRIFSSLIPAFLLCATVSADYYSDQASKMLSDVALASKASDVFNPTTGMLYTTMAMDYENYIFNILKQKNPSDIQKATTVAGQIGSNKEYRDTLLTITQLLVDEKLIAQEVIELAKEKIAKSTNPAGPNYDAFENDQDTIDLYNKIYGTDKWIRVLSKKWVYSAAGMQLLSEKAQKSIALGEKLSKPELIEVGMSIFCSLESYGNFKAGCGGAENLLTTVNAKVDAANAISTAKQSAALDASAKDAQIEAEKTRQQALKQSQAINEEHRAAMVLKEKQATDEAARTKGLEERQEKAVTQKLNDIGIPAYLRDKKTGSLGYDQGNGTVVGSGLVLKDIVVRLTDLNCEVTYDGSILPNSKAFDIGARNCDVTLYENEYAGVPRDFKAKSMEFSVSHQMYKLLDIFIIEKGKIGSQTLDSALTVRMINDLWK